MSNNKGIIPVIQMVNTSTIALGVTLSDVTDFEASTRLWNSDKSTNRNMYSFKPLTSCSTYSLSVRCDQFLPGCFLKAYRYGDGAVPLESMGGAV